MISNKGELVEEPSALETEAEQQPQPEHGDSVKLGLGRFLGKKHEAAKSDRANKPKLNWNDFHQMNTKNADKLFKRNNKESA